MQIRTFSRQIVRSLLFSVALGLLTFAISSCANARLSTRAGIDVRFGPNGPQVRPKLDVSIYGGGRH